MTKGQLAKEIRDNLDKSSMVRKTAGIDECLKGKPIYNVQVKHGSHMRDIGAFPDFI
eukprot:CAMPEP_0170484392 /NCGR_PEP_ID=MMETSP0208-20121228/3875_1 /TAXON_ID=197538 /ORGANISM="Strombidium inclinatum, Strain S3" /LENGTH=56 /DNA_ID=CAMNT_0010757713 /DNA_START=10 /DNA_END=180 /DNA_ORIENTATION=-